MLKKVIDIIPPKNPLTEHNGEESFLKYNDGAPQDEVLRAEPESQPVIETKPRMTFVANKETAGKKRLGFGEAENKSWVKGLVLKLALAAGVVLAAMYGFDLKFANAVVKIWPETSDLRKEVNVAVDPGVQSIDQEKKSIPGLSMSVEDTVKGEFPATGQKNIQGKAQGTVKLFNNYSTTQRLVKGTRLQAPLEKFQPALAKDETPWYRTAEDVVLGSKSSATVKVIADGSGEKYNIESSVFSVPGLVGTAQYTFVYGQSFEKFQGGTQGNAPEVKKEDMENAKKGMVDLAKEQIKKTLEAKVKQQGLEIVDASVIKFEFGEAVITAKAGDSIPKIAVQMNAKASTVAYKKSDFETLGRDMIDQAVAAGSIVDEKSLSIKSSYAGIDPASGKPALALVAQITAYSGMSEDDLKKGLSEKSINEARMFLMNQPGMKNAQIQLTPPWRFNIPRDLDRIQVQTIME
ncbi:MAG: hypothetical protein WCX69_03480 [Candidatus Paceibacterota bacterium]